jgi:hypothetical protein
MSLWSVKTRDFLYVLFGSRRRVDVATMSGFIAILKHKHLYSMRVYIVSPRMVPIMLKRRNVACVDSWCSSLYIHITEKVVFPMIARDNHWFLFVIDIVQHTITYFDPLSETFSEEHKDELRLIKKFMFRRFHWVPVHAWIQLGFMPRQENNFDSGRFVIEMLGCLLANVAPDFDQTSVSIDQYHGARKFLRLLDKYVLVSNTIQQSSPISLLSYCYTYHFIT